MAEKQLWIEPDYFDDFHCKGGACRNSCCSGWDIAVNRDDYFRLIGMNCSEGLHRRLECAFHAPEYPTPERFRLISPNWLGRCPLQRADGLCALHCECGDAALPEICRVYPRSFKREGSSLQACCSNSCEAVIERLMEEDALTFRLVEMDARVEIGEDAHPDIGRTIHECILKLQNRAEGLDARIMAICRMLAGERGVLRGPQALNLLMDALAEMRSESRNLCEYGAAAFERYAGGSAWENYCADRAAFEAAEPEHPRIFENVLTNHIVYEDFPHADPRLSEADACAGLCLLFSAMNVLSAAHLRLHPGREALADVLAGLFHLAEHSSFYYNARVLTKGEWILV